MAVDRSTSVSSSRGVAGWTRVEKEGMPSAGEVGQRIRCWEYERGVLSGRYNAPRAVQMESRRNKLKRWTATTITWTPTGGIWFAGRRLGGRARDFDGEVERAQ